MTRPRRSAAIRRIELRMVTDDPLLNELAQEAERRGVELQQHIYDLLRGRFLLRRGQSLATLLWLPTEIPAVDPSEAEKLADQGASQAASVWAELLGSADA